MTDLELLNFLYELKPESKDQDAKIKKMMNILIYDRNNELSTSIKEYLEPVTIDEIINKSITDVYDHYCDWCKINKYNPESKTTLSKSIIHTFKVKSIVVKINGKNKRIYKF